MQVRGGRSSTSDGRDDDQDPTNAKVLIGNDPRSYRETIALAFGRLRPGIKVFTAEPEDLDREVLRLRPEFVMCSRLSETIEKNAPTWVELYPNGASRSRVCTNGERYTHPDMDLDTLLSILDRAGRPAS